MAAILVLSILINRSYFQLNPLKPSIYIYMFSGSASLLAFFVFMCDPNMPNQGYGLTTLNKPKSREVSTNDGIITQNIFYAAVPTSIETK